ncbi:MAG: carboxylate-amine ligase [Candidatus Marinimicrobia bacterium]|nr:carboxylate-amine ligase [Candidatus Neomarinimicrobiota bacterium]|tara:strand:- start:3352 stop:4458 length:1107 start_codon:yes stop_codon:yes gene_type:complete
MDYLSDLTIGIEEEYQIVDRESRELTSFVSEFLEQGAVLFRDQVKPEFLQSQIEVGSSVCKNVQEAREEICRLRRIVSEIAEKNNSMIVAAGTHPFSSWEDQLVTDQDRYKGLMDSMQLVAKRLLIFGMHIHVGIEDRDLQIDLMNQMSYFMPHILTLSTSSPFWRGEKTGFKSYRSIVFEDLPRTGIPERFDSALEYDNYVKTLVDCGSIDEPSKIWWDIRPHPKFPTLEFRICDCTTRVDEVISIAALIQALVAKLIQYRINNQTWRTYRPSMIAENKWRAMKDGIHGSLIDFGKKTEGLVPFLIEEIIELVDDVLDPLGIRKEVENVRTILNNGASADRQLACYDQTGSMKSVMDQLGEETLEGI